MSENEINESFAERPRKKKVSKKIEKESSSGRTIFILILVACVSGIAVYAWQDARFEGKLEKVSKDAQEARVRFEQDLSEEKSRLKALEDEKNRLSEDNTVLKKFSDLVNFAKSEHNDKERLFSFQFPAKFGSVEAASSSVTSGSFRHSFSMNNSLSFGGLSASAALPSAPSFMDFAGWEEKDGRYYWLPAASSTPIEIKPFKTLDVGGRKILLIDEGGLSGSSSQAFGVGAGNLGALLSLPGSTYKGLAILNADKEFTRDRFEEMLRSLRFSK